MQILKYVLGTAVSGVVWTALTVFVPNFFVRIFMTPTDYIQTLMKPIASFIVSVARGAVVSGMLICILPAVAGADAVWFAMPVTELLVAVYVSNSQLLD